MKTITLNTDVDIDFWDAYEELSNSDKDELVEGLRTDGFIEENDEIPASKTLGEEMYQDQLTKLRKAYYRLSKEQLEFIEEIAKFI